MTGGKSQSDRVLIDAHSRSARAHGERYLAALPHKDRQQREWNDTSFDGGYDFKQRWSADPSNWKAQEKHDATERMMK